MFFFMNIIVCKWYFLRIWHYSEYILQVQLVVILVLCSVHNFFCILFNHQVCILLADINISDWKTVIVGFDGECSCHCRWFLWDWDRSVFVRGCIWFYWVVHKQADMVCSNGYWLSLLKMLHASMGIDACLI